MVTDTIPATMRAAYLTEPEAVELRTVDVPSIKDDEVLVRVEAVGVCGSDVHFYRHAALGNFVVEEPLILGHELAGRIVAVGSKVSQDRIGERVAVEPQTPDLSCEECLAGRYNLCPNVDFYGAPPVDGAFAEFSVIKDIFAHTIPEGVSFEQAAMAEPLSVALYAVRQGHLKPDDRVLVAGAGPIGIMIAQAAFAYGASEVLISDISEERRAFAAKVTGATPIDPTATDFPALKVDVFLDASGAEAAVRAGIKATKVAGSVVMVGVGANDMSLPVVEIRDREIYLTGIYRYRHTWPEALRLIASGKVDVQSLITSRFGLADVVQALTASTRAGEVKSVVLPQE